MPRPSTQRPGADRQLQQSQPADQSVGQALAWAADGNLLSDGTRTCAWDAENRLVSISYPGQPGKLTTFADDGIGRRTAINSAPLGGGTAVITSYLWCGSRLCQARNAAGAVTREYYAEGGMAFIV